jgi:hypothetical protein
MLLLEGIFNDAVKRANGGFMPVAISKDMIITTAGHIPMTATTHLNFLSDFIRIHYQVFSIGDLLGYVGLALAWVGLAWWGIVVARSLITRLYSHYHIDNVI